MTFSVCLSCHCFCVKFREYLVSLKMVTTALETTISWTWWPFFCEQNTLTRHIFSCFTAHISVSHVTLAQVSCAHVIHVSSAWCCCLDTLRLSALHSSPSLSSSFAFSWSSSSSSTWVGSMRSPMRTSANEELSTLAENNSLTGCEPNLIDNYQISETTEIFMQESSSDSRPLNLHDLEIDDYTIGRALSSPLFTQDREDPASRRQAYHSLDESLLSSQSSSVGHVRTGRLVFHELNSQISNVRENPRRSSENEQIRILLERQREQIFADYRAEIQKHEFQVDYDRRNIPKLNEVIQSQRGEIYRAHQGDEQHRRDQQLLHEQLLEQNRELREAHEKSLNEMEELKRFQGSTFDTNSRRRLIEDRDTILELTGKIQELQNEINCINDSRDFQDAESVRSGQCHVTSQPVFFPLVRDLGGMLSRPLGMPSRNNGPPSIWNTHGISGNVFANPAASSSTPYQQELNPWSSHMSEPIYSSPTGKNENQTPVQDQRCQSGPSAKNSIVLSEGGFSKNYGADQQRLQISDPHFDKFLHASNIRLLEDKIQDWGMYLFTISYGCYLWIKEVKLVDFKRKVSGWSKILVSINSTWWFLGRIVQIKNTRVRETQDRIGIVQYGDSSEESWTWLSQIEDNGEKKYRAESTNQEFWSQKRKLWKERRGQESGDKTAWTKNSRRLLLAVESPRAVF